MCLGERKSYRSVLLLLLTMMVMVVKMMMMMTMIMMMMTMTMMMMMMMMVMMMITSLIKDIDRIKGRQGGVGNEPVLMGSPRASNWQGTDGSKILCGRGIRWMAIPEKFSGFANAYGNSGTGVGHRHLETRPVGGDDVRSSLVVSLVRG
ncbi:hypothetical protein E2C01_010322 [Portunus trituberculatus]|uniref:Uncharacterized protein n=1 Tax=Portunus trituberculatus TaxID=210409 RepID=A0A5B7D8B9_PORTR|nr:hypothetical protein [Portunus trituberculatus]